MNQLPYSCGGCPARWSGYTRAHCSVCHCTFGGYTLFDDHRRDGTCLSPDTIGMVKTIRSGQPIWGTVMDDEARARFDGMKS